MEIEFPQKLLFLLDSPARYKIMYGGRGGGKCLAIGTKVIMEDGSLRYIEDIKTGESVMGPDSLPRKVLGTTRGFSQMYKIHQTSGINYIVNSSHILSLKNKNNEVKNINVLNNIQNLFGYNAFNDNLSQIEIEPIGMGEYAGFSLDGDHLFLLEDGTVTHNTEGIARALIILACQKKLRILCCRELQKSIRESVHRTLASQITDMRLDEEFEIQTATISSKRTGSEFIFYGLRHNINSIKSLARIDIAWVEEAVNVSKTSWEKLGPTIRGRHVDDPNGMGGPFGKGPEIWISFNPELDTDETYERFVIKREKYAPNYIEENGEKERYAFVQKLNWSDNKWFPNDLRRDMELLKITDNDEWLNVWEGHTKQVINGAIYAEEIKKVLAEGRRGHVPYDPSKPVHTFWDLGHNDHTAIWFVQQIGVEYNIINYFQDRLKKISYYLEYMQNLKYVYGMHYLPHDAENETLASRSVAKFVRDAYPKSVRIVPRVPKKVVGIRATRAIFELCNFDEENTADGWQCLCRYQYDIDEDGKWSTNPAHNEYSHGADAFQSFALSLKSETAEKKPRTVYSNTNLRAVSHSSTGWMNS